MIVAITAEMMTDAVTSAAGTKAAVIVAATMTIV